ncbi:hypothetical protein Ccrd_001989 [Cynara cardunculus var. scolymus]|uniref:Uncharacterized protein n=1 Tax=Cynara cardunculus var. scolymus TaxID=59895 RepID=A0A118JWI9_CYNCS|nr:hypothetical protein Ccrd_001989 [Cynara cardunculus var. scolymus]
MSVAFMVGVSLVVADLTWLANFVLIFGIISLANVLTLFIPLCLPYTSTSLVLRYITYYPFHLLILASASSDDRQIKDMLKDMSIHIFGKAILGMQLDQIWNAI